MYTLLYWYRESSELDRIFRVGSTELRHLAAQVFALIDSDGSGMLSMVEIKEAVRPRPCRGGMCCDAFGDIGTALPEKVGIFSIQASETWCRYLRARRIYSTAV